MTYLSCDVMNCINNKDRYCCRPDIQVSGRSANDPRQTSCASFSDATDSAQNAVGTVLPNTSLEIYCEAENCKYNHEERCSAEHINIDAESEIPHSQSYTQCGTFESK
ncbi:DUF1540 domain-containing protein [Caproiciproducens galactitolivorans]|uniref:DUF1540 domain-containing protein n=1 Tax=Caproiciproducens galactitolivorans TaxID=642589 RepID=A0A4Z0Y0B0_9FIRM|nr:DUF1540 domain-containing protein [Caproiciproducens galactitolivorans]QEY33611.1 DUF1540 domain-containing protein [Caproiciproducens galactitolivorans]TGJ76277.1 hypothetical protein CAGA_17410 [Caproiciproducens galactitolivorans]